MLKSQKSLKVAALGVALAGSSLALAEVTANDLLMGKRLLDTTLQVQGGPLQTCIETELKRVSSDETIESLKAKAARLNMIVAGVRGLDASVLFSDNPEVALEAAAQIRRQARSQMMEDLEKARREKNGVLVELEEIETRLGQASSRYDRSAQEARRRELEIEVGQARENFNAKLKMIAELEQDAMVRSAVLTAIKRFPRDRLSAAREIIGQFGPEVVARRNLFRDSYDPLLRKAALNIKRFPKVEDALMWVHRQNVEWNRHEGSRAAAREMTVLGDKARAEIESLRSAIVASSKVQMAIDTGVCFSGK